jgi:acyl carrier protein
LKEDLRDAESILVSFIGGLVVVPDNLPLKSDTPLIRSGLLDSLSLLKLVVFIEERFGVKLKADEIIPENFDTISAICGYLRSRNAD